MADRPDEREWCAAQLIYIHQLIRRQQNLSKLFPDCKLRCIILWRSDELNRSDEFIGSRISLEDDVKDLCYA